MEEIASAIIAIIFITVILGFIMKIGDDLIPKIKTQFNNTIDSKKKESEEANLDKKLERLQKLGQLLKDGLITKEEFEKQKNKIKL